MEKEAYNLVIGGTLFPHSDIHKLTWCSPNGRDKNQTRPPYDKWYLEAIIV
jgi:hypothetical protein